MSTTHVRDLTPAAAAHDWRRVAKLAAAVAAVALLLLALWAGLLGLLVDAWSTSAPMLVQGAGR